VQRLQQILIDLMQPAQFGGCITAQAISAELPIKFIQSISQPQGFG
jgi:hypothetical protein